MRSEVWAQHLNEVVETLRRAMQDVNMSIDELAALSGVDRAEILAVLAGKADVLPKSSAVLAAILSGRIAEQARQRSRRETVSPEAYEARKKRAGL